MQTPDTFQHDGPRHVTCEQRDGAYRLLVDGETFFVKGAGGASDRVANLASHGANSLRTWSTKDAGRILDEALAAGLMVLMGLRVVPERHGFDYGDGTAVRQQLLAIEKEVRSYMDHPALLAWGIGNELNLSYENPLVWNAVNDIARMIHQIDAHHPATTMLSGVRTSVVDQVTERCPELDFLCVQMYADVVNARRKIEQVGYDGPYLITEWGATGHWEVARTEWNAPIEQTSSEKADALLERYEAAIVGDPSRCMGSYVFLWGQKQERTPTWYGLFTEDGRETEAVDAMHCLWTGAWPDHRAPRLSDITIDGKGRYDSLRLARGASATARPTVVVPSDSAVRAWAEVLPEATELGEGGDYEPRPTAIPGVITATGPDAVEFTAPSEPGAYRLFVYVLDDHGHAATANLPFLVE